MTEDDKQIEALGKLPSAEPLPKLTESQFAELLRREELADIKARKSRDAEERARRTILINALIALVALLAEALRQYSASRGR